MADNVAITEGSGTTIATDDVAGVHYQKIKLYDASDASTNAAIVDSAGLNKIRPGTYASVETRKPLAVM